ncbi:Uncharacterised protein [Bordetella pertussis]|nr:Uncharacterised protein [Bordetella pertussis]CPN19231.1 Uncharacterised protein [Bordetella pertussis]
MPSAPSPLVRTRFCSVYMASKVGTPQPNRKALVSRDCTLGK